MVRINKVSGNQVLYLQFLSFLEPHQLGIPGIVLTLWAAGADSPTGGSPGLEEEKTRDDKLINLIITIHPLLRQ